MLAINGTTLRRSFDRAAGRKPLHVVAAFGAQARLLIGQSAVLPGGNGITARALPETLCLEGVLVTADAIHARAKRAALILQPCGDCLLALKGNHPPLAAEVAGHCAENDVKRKEYQTVDADHGRIGTRIHRVDHDVDRLFPDCRSKGGRAFRAWPASPASRVPARPAKQGQPPHGSTCPRPASRQHASPPPSAPIGPSGMRPTGCQM